MARKRTIDPDLWTDDRVQSLPSTTAILLYIGTISMADDDGRLEWSSRQLLARVFAQRDDVKLRDVEIAMAAIADSGLVVVYEVGGRSFGVHPAWRKHQYVSRPSKSKLPEPPRGTSRSPHVEPHGFSEDSRSRHVPSVSDTETVSDTGAASPSGARGFADVLDDDEVPLPANGRAAHGPAFDFAAWFIQAAVEAKVLGPHLLLDVAGAAYREMPAAEPLVATYGLDELQRRAKNLFARKANTGDLVAVDCSIKTLSFRWDWFDSALSPSAKRAATQTATSPTVPERSIERAADAGGSW